MNEIKPVEAVWKVNAPSLLSQVLDNPGTGVLRIPLKVLTVYLSMIAERAAELNDPKLNALMRALSLYEVANPSSEEYDPELVEKLINEQLTGKP